MALPTVRQANERRRERVARKKEARAAKQAARQEKKQSKRKGKKSAKAQATHEHNPAEHKLEQEEVGDRAAQPSDTSAEDVSEAEQAEDDPSEAGSRAPDEADDGEQPEEDAPLEDDESETEDESPFEDALLDIFAEEMESTYYDVLLHGLDDVAIDELVTLCDQVAGELSERMPTPMEQEMAE